MDDRAIGARRRMAEAARNLHYYADLLVTLLEGQPILEQDDAAGDEARAALDNARAWRRKIEEA